MFSYLCGDSAYPRIALGTTKWPQFGAETTHDSRKSQAESRLSVLENRFWKDLIGLGSKTYRIDTTESALQLVRSILDKLELTTEGGELVLQLQKEVVDEGKSVPQTKAGMILEMAEGRKNFRYAGITEEEKAAEKLMQKQLEEMDRELAKMDRELAQLATKKNTFSRVSAAFRWLATRLF